MDYEALEDKAESATPPAAEPAKNKEKTIADVVEGQTKLDGLFTLYRDEKSGRLSMEIRKDQLNKEFIYFAHTANSVVDAGHFRGQYLSQKVFKIEKHYNAIEFIEINPHFYFDPENALSRAQDANITPAILLTAYISAESADKGSYLINADSLFDKETFVQIRPSYGKNSNGNRFKLGKLSSLKTQITDVHNYDENTVVTVNYVFHEPYPGHRGNGADMTDARNVTVSVQHTLLAMPENDFKPRFDDPRIGYFTDYVNDMTSRSATPWRDMINRWNLVKKDPTAKLSEPVKPITWWIENTTPEELRPTIKAAAERWNIAFEAAGFKNAIVVKIQPDDATWDAGDVRYNVLRWMSSPRPIFGGYGPSFTNPRTGEILGADVMLEYTFLTNRLNAGKVFETSALFISDEEKADKIGESAEHEKYCDIANYLQLNNMVGQIYAKVLGRSGKTNEKLLKEAIYYLVLHEIGHTLGLNHNMKATQARPYAEAHDIDAQGDGLVGSVMDYPSINFAPPGKTQSHYYTITPGPYDIWAIQFGYSDEMEAPEAQAALLARSTEKKLAFGNDADDMRSPGKGIDPRINIFDFSDDAVAYAKDRLKLSKQAMGKLLDNFTTDGESYQELRNAYLILTSDMTWQGRVASRYIGGVYVNRAVAGQEGAESPPYTPVDEGTQKRAMKLLRDYIFSPSAFSADQKLLRHLAIQRRGFNHYFETEDPKIHGRVSAIQADILNHLLHPRTLTRLTDTALYGNTYSLTEMMSDLTDAIFEDDSRGAVTSIRQELQIMYVKALINIMNSNGYAYVARSNAFASLRNINKNMTRWRGDASTRAHRDHLAFLINRALEVHKD